MEKMMSGNEAAARGAYEAGVRVCSAYPGTPSTEIFENLPQYGDALYCEWAPNEKVACEVAYGASIAGVRAMCAMKHVGVNVAADPIFTAAYNGAKGGFVIVSADDPSMHSSQNEQDNRNYARFARLPLLEPADSEECRSYMHAAFEISERYKLPVLYRMTTRLCHSKSIVECSERFESAAIPYRREPQYICTPANAYKNRPILEQKLRDLEAYANQSPLNRMEMASSDVGVITSGLSYYYAKEAFPDDTSFLKLGLTNPLPMALIRDFAARVDRLYIVEELDPFMETAIRAAGIDCIGKEVIPAMYELNAKIIREAVFGKEQEEAQAAEAVVPRPPVLCPGCPHRGFFYTVGKDKDHVISGDIGCYTLGAAAPLSAVDSVVCMGGGFSVGMGMAKTFELTGQNRTVFGVVGDSTFFHSGMTGAAEIIYNGGRMIPCVLDNSITGMTGHQDNPGSGKTLQGEIAQAIRIEDVLSGLGFDPVIIVDPQDLAAMQNAVDRAKRSEGKPALVVRRPCLLIKGMKHEMGKCAVDTEKCRGCKRCIGVGCPAVAMQNGKAVIDVTLCTGCTVCAQVCPFHAIEKKT